LSDCRSNKHVQREKRAMIDHVRFHGAGKSSFDFLDIPRVIQALSLTPSTVFLDLGCGRGNFPIAVAAAIGMGGRVYGVDAWQEGLDELNLRAAAEGLNNVVTVHANLYEHIPLEDGTIDLCLLSTVLHDLLREDSGQVVMDEIVRVLKPGGRAAIIEFKKIENSPGPPLSVRLSPEETDSVIAPFGFVSDGVIDVGSFHYLLSAHLADR
jgi:ubiquinone/menaquinone biosynthesis C-methylase UbiE